MNHFRVIIDFFGDLGGIEMAIDEVVSSIPATELDSVDIEIRNEGLEDDA